MALVIRRKPLNVGTLFRVQSQEWLDGARAAARELLGTKRFITIDDVLEVYPRPSYVHRNITGAVFKTDDFVWSGVQKSVRPVSNGRLISKWRARY